MYSTSNIGDNFQTIAAEQHLPVVNKKVYRDNLNQVVESDKYVLIMIYRCILDSLASEHAARMVAMQNATDNAKELVDDLTLDLNKARQEAITSELLDLVGGMSAIENKYLF